MASRADLNTHSRLSDGVLSPTELVELAYRRGVRVLALTDHDITDGLPEAFAAARRYPDFTLIPGIEMSVDVPGNEVHILGYFIDWQDKTFQAELARLCSSRLDRGRKMVERLRELGMPLSWERVQEIAGVGAVGRPHVAQAMREAGYVTTINEAFDRYLARNAPAYMPHEKKTPEEVVAMLGQVGGLPVLAHPRDLADRPDLLRRLKAVGLVGMEVYYQDYAPEDIQSLLAEARALDLLPLGGSDYHGLGGPQQREPGDIPLPDEPVQHLLEMAERRGVLARALA